MGMFVRAVLPHADSQVEVVDAATGLRRANLATLIQVDPVGIFDGPGPAPPRNLFAYRLRAHVGRRPPSMSKTRTVSSPVLGELDVWLLDEGRHLRLHEKLGPHPATLEGVDGNSSFAAVGAECAARRTRRRFQSLGREASSDAAAARVRRMGDLLLPRLWSVGARYKFSLLGSRGSGAAAEGRSGSRSPPSCVRRRASIVAIPPAPGNPARGRNGSPGNSIGAKMPDRRSSPQAAAMPGPVAARDRAVVDLRSRMPASWRRGEQADDGMTWREIGRATGFPICSRQWASTHVEFLPVMEHPFCKTARGAISRWVFMRRPRVTVAPAEF